MNKVTISEVIDSFGVSKITYRIYFLVCTTLLFAGIVFMIAPFTMPQISAELELTRVQTGALSSWLLLGLMFGGFAAGVISDRIGRKTTLIIATLVYGTFTIPIYFVSSFEAFAVFRILAGVGVGACIPVVVTLMSEYAPTKRRGYLTASTLSFYVLGWVVAGLIAMYVIPLFGWRFVYLIGVIPTGYVLILALGLIESPHWLLGKGREQDAINVIEKIETAVKGKTSEWVSGSLIAPTPPKSVGIKALFTPEYRAKTMALCVIYFMGTMVIYGITSWMPTLLVERGYGVVASYSFSTMLNVAQFCGAVLTGIVADVIGRRKNVYMAWFVTAIVIIIMGFATSQWQVLVVGALVGFAMCYGMTSVQPVLAEAFRTEFRNTGVATSMAFGRLGGAVGPIIAGFILQIGLGFTGTFLFFAIPALITSVVAYFFVAETKGKSIENVAIAETKVS